MRPFSAAVGLLALCAPALARAQVVTTERERVYLERGIPAPSGAFELTVASGYTQGFGELRSGLGMPQVASGGVGIEGSFGYRIEPRWSVSLGAQYQELTPENATAARGATLTIAAQYHAAPSTRLDPWLELGGGHRLLWQIDPMVGPDTIMSHGVQLARVRIGFDVRLSPEVAVAPLIGADASIFLWQDAASANVRTDPSLSTFVFAGVLGRVDFGGTQVGTTTITRAVTK